MSCAECEGLRKRLSEASSRWIPVGERLPSDDGRVLVTDVSEGDGADERDIGYYDDDDNKWYWEEGFSMSSPPTHWMPLPEPPK